MYTAPKPRPTCGHTVNPTQQIKDELLEAYRDYVKTIKVGLNSRVSLSDRADALLKTIDTQAKITALEAKLKELNDTAPSSGLTKSHEAKS